MGKKVIIIIIALLLVVAGVLVYFFVLAPKETEALEVFYNMGDAFITNVNGTEDMLLKTTCQLMICREETEALTAQNAKIRDCVLKVLRTAPAETLTSPDAQDVLSTQICAELNTAFASLNTGSKGEALDPLFTKVLFTDLLTQ
ncbi:MAG: flagellar basal body-associated FliL family protein [Eubacteriales bacterium]|nr:flagellar basal body-associated FliL family protein [Eubacteriales bacterium]